MVNDSNVPREQRRQRAATESEAARPILVAVDGSPATASLITVARMMVGVWQAPVCLLHVANEPVSDESLRSRLGLEPADLIGLLLDSCLGDPIAAILRVAAERESPLVVLGTYGWTADPTASMGHVAEGVLREAHCPVLLIGPEAAKRFRDRSTSPMQILMPLNGTPPTAAALSRVTRPLSQVRAVFDVLHVVSPSGTSAGEEGAFSVPRYMDQPHHAWQAWRREFASRFLHPLGIEARSIRVGVGDPGD